MGVGRGGLFGGDYAAEVERLVAGDQDALPLPAPQPALPDGSH